MVDGDAAQPVAKGARVAVVNELRQPGHDHREHLLDDVVDIVGLAGRGVPPRAAEERGVQFDETLPIGVAARLYPLQETGRGVHRLLTRALIRRLSLLGVNRTPIPARPASSPGSNNYDHGTRSLPSSAFARRVAEGNRAGGGVSASA